jgi:hypothetical protein
VPYPGFSAAPSVATLTPADATIGPSNAGSSQAFAATTNRSAAAVGWSLDGSPQGGADAVGTAGTNWSFTFQLGSVDTTPGVAPAAGEAFDGTYTIGAQAFDRYGAYGRSRITTLTLNRRQPYKLINFRAVHVGSTVALDWARSPERDITGYAIYHQVGAGSLDLVKTIDSVDTTSWTDTAPPPSAGVVYIARAVERDSAGHPHGDDTASASLDLSQSAPQPPSSLNAFYDSTQKSVGLTWTAAPGSVAGYRIYRDGSGLSAQYDTVTGGSTTTYTDTKLGGVSHQYWIAAIDASGAESTTIGPVSSP